jgi:hypothetical protein
VTEPTLRILSLGAGVQSTTIALMACDGTLPGLDGAIFADTGWEPDAVYRQVKRLSEDLWWKNIPTFQVSRDGNIRTDATDPTKRFLSLPWYTLAPVEDAKKDCRSCHGTGVRGDRHCRCREGMGRRQCTAVYKIEVIMRQTRKLLGAKAPNYRTVPRGRVAEQWIGFSTDEIHRVNDKPANLYTRPRYPLLELGMSRKDCERWLKAKGWGHTVKSACIGCPLHGNAHWRDMRDNRPHEWRQAVEYDRLIRKGGARGAKLRGEAFLHRARVPLDQAPIDHVTANEWVERQVDMLDVIADLDLEVLENGATEGCSPYGCRSGEPVFNQQEVQK